MAGCGARENHWRSCMYACSMMHMHAPRIARPCCWSGSSSRAGSRHPRARQRSTSWLRLRRLQLLLSLWPLGVHAQTCTPALTDPSNGRVFVSNGGVAPSTALFVCDLGYTLTGTQELTCAAGTWSAGAPTCTPKACVPLTAPPDGSFSYSNSGMFPSTATLTCNAGFQPSANTQPVCQETGYYSGLVPTCKKIQCAHPSTPVDGTVTVYRDANQYITQADYACNAGYTLSPASPVSRFCTNGAWDLAPPTCTPVTCTALSAPANGAYLYEPSSMLYPTWATLKCNAGYVLQSSNLWATGCYPNGIFQGTAPSCVEVSCDVLSKPPGGSWTPPSPAVPGTSGTYACDSGYTQTSGSTTRTCQSAGHWDGSVAVCTPN